jgi:hypothetical protein
MATNHHRKGAKAMTNGKVNIEGAASILECETTSVLHLQGVARLSTRTAKGERVWKPSDLNAWKVKREQAKAKAKATAKKPTPPKECEPQLSKAEKAVALVGEGLASDAQDARAQLEDMGE